MAAKLSLRERARVALGDFSYTEDALREKMAAIYEKDARENGEDDFSIGLHKAVIMRDGNLDAFEVKTKKPALDEKTEKDIQAAAHSFAVGYAAMRAEAGKTESPPPSPAARQIDWNDYFVDDNGAFIVGPNYPSIDHVHPLSKGGLHAWDNVRLAHCHCNTLKRDTILNDIHPSLFENF